MPRFYSRVVAPLALVLAAISPSGAQVTGGTLAGRITTNAGAPLSGAVVAATYMPTGARYGAQTADDGRFVIANARSGGPYSITVRRIGYKQETRNDIYLSLGNTTRVDIMLGEVATALGGVTVTAESDPLIDKNRTGPSTNIGRSMIENLPTLGRSLQDITRLSPQGNANSFAGTNFRYNNITIDGAASNDVFSFSPSQGGVSGVGPSGTPGAGARTQPISLDAIEEVQVTLAPFDVKLGNFTGGSINAVTRSGTNETSGSFYSYGRNQMLTGRSADEARSKIPSYSDYQIGGRIGGAFIPNKAFFFLNVDVAHRNEPIGFAPGDVGTVINASTASALLDTLRSRYNYDGGSVGAFTNLTESRKLFARMDFNLSDIHKLNIRHNFVDAHAQNFARGGFLTKFGSQDFTQSNRTNSSVAELKSTWAGGVSNSLIAGASFTRDGRDVPGQIFPQVEISGPSGSSIFLGTDREASVFKIGTSVLELTDNLTVARGAHTWTIGTHNEMYGIQYNFLNAYNGRWQYSSLANFYANKPSRIRGQYNLTDNSLDNVKGTPQADFRVLWPSAYVQDEIAFLGDRLHVTPGLRVDIPSFPDRVPTNAALTSTPATSQYANEFGGDVYVSPRVSFNWDVKGDQTLQLRGGTGRFTGRIPFAWYAYAYENTGLQLGNVDCRPSATSGCAGNSATVPLVTDPTQLKNLQSGVFEANLIDNHFKLPTINRSSLAVDVTLPLGLVATLEGMYTKSIYDVKFLNIGLKDSSVASAVDGRPIFQGSPTQLRVNPNFSSVFLLTNTADGDRYSLTAQLRKTLSHGMQGAVAYTHGQSRDVSNGIRNSPQSNWEFNQVSDPRSPSLTYSNFDIRHRVIANLGWQRRWTEGVNTGVTLIYSGTSGSPFTFVYGSDANRDGSGSNDLVYVPKDFADARIVPVAGDTRTAAEIWAQLNDFIMSQPGLDASRGSITGRNSGRTPWNHQVDMRISQDLPVVRGTTHRAQLSLDVINLGALLGTTLGRQYFVPNENNYNFQAIKVSKTDPSGAPSGFTFDPVPNNQPWQYDALNSRYQAQIGLRYLF
ncbi:MAG: TonB-dependent receptor [Gemmatimonadaceae bacterium]|nr:TonB-dependent receptor [Gemmatimonadaceae bacterium]